MTPRAPEPKQIALGLWLVLVACSGAKDSAPVPLPPVVKPPPVAVVPDSAGAITSFQGVVTVEHAGVAHAIAAPTPFATHDAIDTAEDASATLTFTNGRVVELGPNGRFEVGEEGGGVVLSISRGLVLTRVPATPAPARDAGPEVSLTISTPFGLTRVSATSEVKVAVDAKRADVEVRVGEIQLVSKSGQRSTLVAGKRSQLGASRELPTIAVAIVVATGRVELKGRDAKAFSAMSLKKVPALQGGDVLRVIDGRLTLAPEAGQTRVTLTRGSEAQVVNAAKGEGGEATALELKRGELQVEAPRAPARVAVGNGVTLQSDLGAHYTVRRGPNGQLEVSSQVGDLTLQREGKDDVSVGGGASAVVVPGGEVRLAEAAHEAVVLPTHNGLRVAHSGLSRASLAWDSVDGVGSWRVVVATDAAMASVVLDGVVRAPFVNVAVPARGPLFWRVFANGGAEETVRGNAAFGPDQLEDLSRVKNVVPDGPETTTIYFQDKPPTVTFTWAADQQAAKYSVKVFREGELTKAVAERTVAETQVALPESTLAEGKYRWSVTSLDARGAEVKGGRLNKLAMVYDNAVAQLVLKSPKNGEAAGATVRVSGVAPVGSRVFVNARPAVLDEKARFELQVPSASLPQGRVVVRVINAGTESFTVRTVRR